MKRSPDRTLFNQLFARSDYRGLRRLTTHIGALCASGWLIYAAPSPVARLAAMWVYGTIGAFLFCAAHESIHRTAFRSRRLNDAVACAAGLVLLLPSRYFRAFHLGHHRHTQDPKHDPELATPKPATLPAYLWHVSGLPYWQERIGSLFRHARARVEESFIAPGERTAIIREARGSLLIYSAVAAISFAADSPTALYYWVIPALLGQPILRLFLLAEHTGCPLTRDMLKNSHTTHTTAPVRLLTWNMPFHTAHHRYPAVPFHRLPAMHRRLAPGIAVQSTGYLALHRSILSRLWN